MFFAACQIGEDHFEVTAKFPQDLPACAAGRRELVGVGNDRDAAEFAMTFRERFEHGDALSANREAVGGILDITAGNDYAVIRLEGGADLETRKRRDRIFADFDRCDN